MLYLDLEKQFQSIQRIVKYIPETLATEVVSEDPDSLEPEPSPAAPVLPAVAPLKMKELVNILGNMRN